MTQQKLNIIIGGSQYDCAECAAANMLAPPFVYIYDESTLAKYPTLPGDAIINITYAFEKGWNADIYGGVRKAMGLFAGPLKLFGFLKIYYPVSAVQFINFELSNRIALYFGMTIQIQAKSVLLDWRGIHVLEGEIIDAA